MYLKCGPFKVNVNKLIEMFIKVSNINGISNESSNESSNFTDSVEALLYLFYDSVKKLAIHLYNVCGRKITERILDHPIIHNKLKKNYMRLDIHDNLHTKTLLTHYYLNSRASINNLIVHDDIIHAIFRTRDEWERYCARNGLDPVVRAIRESSESSEGVGRYYDEEFATLIAQTDEDIAPEILKNRFYFIVKHSRQSHIDFVRHGIMPAFHYNYIDDYTKNNMITDEMRHVGELFDLDYAHNHFAHPY